MKKATFRLFSMLMALPLLLGLASCVDNDDNPAVKDGTETVEAPDETLPTSDQMNVLVTADLHAAVMANFDEGTTGAALVKRLPQTAAAIDLDTRLVVLPGTDFSMANPTTIAYNMADVARVYLGGGYIALVQPTNEQFSLFSLVLLAGVAGLEAEAYEQMFDIDAPAAARAATHSDAAERLKARAANLQQAAATRAEGVDPNAPFAEIIIFGPTDYFMQDALPDVATAYVHTADAEGNETAPQAVTTRTERTPYTSGLLADAAADWLNTVEQQPAAAARRAVTRASGSSAINEMMDASETFTYSGAIDWRAWDNNTYQYTNRVTTILRSWGVHNMESNKDYYYVKQNVTLKMGGSPKIFWPLGENTWYPTSNYGSYDRWYGSFLSQYETSMNLTGSGNIFLEAATPSTDNSTQTTSVNIGSSTSTTVTNGISYGGSIGGSPAGPMANISIGGSYSVGTTNGSSFTMGMTQTHKDFGVKKNTSGNKVTWTYNGTLPQYYVKETSDTYYYMHQIPADILVNDCDVADEICWSVSNPSGQYTVDVTSAPQTAALLYAKNSGSASNRPHKYEYTTTPTETYSHQLLEPNRTMQKWRMYITIDEWEGSPIAGAQGQLESNILNQFPDVYNNVFSVADKTATSLTTITYVINYAKQVFTQNNDVLLNYAKSWGIRQFTIHWRCDDLNVTTREGFTVKEPCTFTATDGTGEGYGNLFDGDASTIWRTSAKKDGVYFVEFKGSRVITPTAYMLTTGAYTSTHPTERPKDWKLMARLNPTDAWTTIATVTNDTRLPAKSGQTARYDLDVTGQRWQYFRLEVSATQGQNRVNLGDLAIDY